MKLLHRVASNKLQALVIALSVALFFAVLVPAQTYLANHDMFEFGLSDVLIVELRYFITIFFATTVLLLMSQIALGRCLFCLLSAVLLCEYLEIGVLSIGLPPLNGGILVYGNFTRKFLDFAVISLILAFSVIFFKKIQSWCHWVALIVVTMMFASLLDVHHSDSRKTSILDDGLCNVGHVASSTRFSENGNVILLILDSFPAPVASQIVAEEDLAKHFPGFVAYENNVGMHGFTARGLPGLMTGRFLRSDESASDYMYSVYSEESLLYPYVVDGNPVYYSSDMLTSGYTNSSIGDWQSDGLVKMQEAAANVLDRCSIGVPYITLREVMEFRLVPYRWKADVLYKAYGRMKTTLTEDTECFREATLYANLMKNKPQNTKKVLSVFHTYGVHQPINFDRYGNILAGPRDDIDAHKEYGVYVFSQLVKFFDWLHEMDIYDNSLIVIAADHGLQCLRKGDGREGYGSDTPILWVKTPHNNDAFKFSQLPTSNVKIKDLILAARTCDVDIASVESILETHNRCFIEQFGTSFFSHGNQIYFYKWLYDDEGNVVSCENIGRFKGQ